MANVKVTIVHNTLSSQQWLTLNPILKKGELGFENNTNKFKIGDGINDWNQLDYIEADLSDFFTKQEIQSLLDNKVDAIPNKVLSDENFTSDFKGTIESLHSVQISGDYLDLKNIPNLSKEAIKELYEQNVNTNEFSDQEKDKLQALESSKYRGYFQSIGHLEDYYTDSNIDPLPGEYADIDDPETFGKVVRVIWDQREQEWSPLLGSTTSLTAQQVKSLYETNPNTNAFTDLEKQKVGSLHAVQTSGSYNDLIDVPQIPDVPQKTSDLINDSGFVSTDTTYTQGNGIVLEDEEFSIDSTVQLKSDLPTKVSELILDIDIGATYTQGTGLELNGTEFSLTQDTQDDIQEGKDAKAWGDHSQAGYVSTDTTYTAGTGLELNGTEFSIDSTVQLKSELPTDLDDLTDNTNKLVDTTYTQGTGLELDGTEFSIDSTVQLKSELPQNVSELNNDQDYVTTDTQYQAGTGLDLTGTEFSIDSTVQLKSELPTDLNELSDSDGLFAAKENAQNKVNTFSSGDSVEFPTTQAVIDYLTTNNYVTQATLPQDKFLNNAEVIDDNGEPKLKLTLSDTSEVLVSLQDLIPVQSEDGIDGDGTQSNPLKANYTEIQTGLGLADVQTSGAYGDLSGTPTFTEGNGISITKVGVDNEFTIDASIVQLKSELVDTTYTAGNGLTLSGTEFTLPVTGTSTGPNDYVKSVVQDQDGITVTYGTPAVYDDLTVPVLKAGTETEEMVVSQKTLRDVLSPILKEVTNTDSQITINDYSLQGSVLNLTPAQSDFNITLGNPGVQETFSFKVNNKSTVNVSFTDGNILSDLDGNNIIRDNGLVEVTWTGTEWLIRGDLKES